MQSRWWHSARFKILSFGQLALIRLKESFCQKLTQWQDNRHTDPIVIIIQLPPAKSILLRKGLLPVLASWHCIPFDLQKNSSERFEYTMSAFVIS